jgi:hypothetical protein
MANLDWFYEGSLMTCTVESETCSSKSFTTLLTTSGIAQPPEFELFPLSPFNILTSNQMVLHVELSSPTERITVIWQHRDALHNQFIYEDPFCDSVHEASCVCVCDSLDFSNLCLSFCRNVRMTLTPGQHCCGRRGPELTAPLASWS